MLVLCWRGMATKWWKIEKTESFCTFFAQHLLACLPSPYQISVSNNRVWGVRESKTEDNSTKNCLSKLDIYKAMEAVEMCIKNIAGDDVILRLLSAIFEISQPLLQGPSDWKKAMLYSIRKSREGNLGNYRLSKEQKEVLGLEQLYATAQSEDQHSGEYLCRKGCDAWMGNKLTSLICIMSLLS